MTSNLQFFKDLDDLVCSAGSGFGWFFRTLGFQSVFQRQLKKEKLIDIGLWMGFSGFGHLDGFSLDIGSSTRLINYQSTSDTKIIRTPLII